MMMEQNTRMTDKQKMADLLSCEKFLAGNYNTYCMEAATTSVRSCLCTILTDIHGLQEGIFEEMNSRGWYPLETAEIAKVQAEKQKFAQSVNA